MLPRRAIPSTLLGLLAGMGFDARAAGPVWVSHEVPPYLWLGASGPEGYAFDLFKHVVRQAALPADLHFYPWARAFRMLQTGQAHAVPVIARSPDREAQFRWMYPVGRFRFAVFTRASLEPPPADIAALRPHRIGSLRASVSRTMLESAGVPHIVEGKDYAELLALLNRGIVDAVIGPEPVLRSVDTRTGGGEALRVTLLDQGCDFYAAAGPGMSEEAVQRVRSAYQHLVDAGVVAQLRKKHPEASFAD